MTPIKLRKIEADGKQNMAVVLIKGTIGAKSEVKSTLEKLRLRTKNACVIVKNTPSFMGMLNKVKDLTTYGEVSDETIRLLQDKRGQKDAKTGELKPFFRLNPPRKGFERKGTKIPFTVGGALGYRGDKINDLIQRMI